MHLIIDNYDSFTWNVAQYVAQLGREVKVVRNDEIDVAGVAALSPESIIISPGPGRPDGAGCSKAVVEHFRGKIPVLGVCLGHQCIVEVYGGRIDRAERIMHGKVSSIHHDGRTIYEGLPDPFVATRYHSLIALPKDLPSSLEISARTEEGEIMGVRAREEELVEGVQFHPESVLTPVGLRLLERFLDAAEGVRT